MACGQTCCRTASEACDKEAASPWPQQKQQQLQQHDKSDAWARSVEKLGLSPFLEMFLAVLTELPRSATSRLGFPDSSATERGCHSQTFQSCLQSAFSAQKTSESEPEGHRGGGGGLVREDLVLRVTQMSFQAHRPAHYSALLYQKVQTSDRWVRALGYVL